MVHRQHHILHGNDHFNDVLYYIFHQTKFNLFIVINKIYDHCRYHTSYWVNWRESLASINTTKTINKRKSKRMANQIQT